MRQELVKQIAKQYVEKYTCAEMADYPISAKPEIDQANDWLFAKINELHITKDELQKAINECENDAVEQGTACCYDNGLFSTKFFRG